MNISWRTYDLASMIRPGDSLADFEVKLPDRPQNRPPLYNLLGELSVPLEMNQAPFRAYFEDGSCVWGRVLP